MAVQYSVEYIVKNIIELTERVLFLRWKDNTFYKFVRNDEHIVYCKVLIKVPQRALVKCHNNINSHTGDTESLNMCG